MPDAPSQWFSASTKLPISSSLRAKTRAGWFAEGFSPHEFHFHGVERVLQNTRTRFQECVLADTYSYGRCLVLDGETQSSQKDEFIYHEMLAQPAMLSVTDPKQVLVLGGGEGATLREVLRHPQLEQVLMADIDEQVMEFCIKYLKPWHQGAFDHPKVRLLIEDARLLVLGTRRRFDVILSDLPSAIRGGPAYKLYSIEFYRKLRERLTPRGVFCLQAGSGQMLQIQFHAALYNTLKHVFPVVRPYYAYIPAYDIPWAFIFCSNDRRLDPLKLSGDRIDRRIKERKIRGLRFMDGTTYEGLFRPPKYLRDRIQAERRVIRENKPMYFFDKELYHR